MRKKFIESILCWAFPNFGFTPLKPVRLQPVYFPAWILDVELQGQVSIKGIDVRLKSKCSRRVPNTILGS